MQRLAAILVVLIASAPALMAHPGHGPSDFAGGFRHPWSGLDHVAAMLAVGLLAVRCGGHARWLVPLSFLTAMILGGALGGFHTPLPGVEMGIALSVLALGTLVALATPPATWIAVLVVAAGALFHGHAHVVEMGSAALGPYCAGFVLATALLHGLGILLAMILTNAAHPVAVRVGGAMVAATGVVLVIGA